MKYSEYVPDHKIQSTLLCSVLYTFPKFHESPPIRVKVILLTGRKKCGSNIIRSFAQLWQMQQMQTAV